MRVHLLLAIICILLFPSLGHSGDILFNKRTVKTTLKRWDSIKFVGRTQRTLLNSYTPRHTYFIKEKKIDTSQTFDIISEMSHDGINYHVIDSNIRYARGKLYFAVDEHGMIADKFVVHDLTSRRFIFSAMHIPITMSVFFDRCELVEQTDSFQLTFLGIRNHVMYKCHAFKSSNFKESIYDYPVTHDKNENFLKFKNWSINYLSKGDKWIHIQINEDADIPL